MPTYEYECEACGHHFEAFQGMSDAPLRDCPKCQRPVHRLVSGGGGFILKGRGFHATDYPKGAPAPACGHTSRCCGRSEPCDAPPCAD